MTRQKRIAMQLQNGRPRRGALKCAHRNGLALAMGEMPCIHLAGQHTTPRRIEPARVIPITSGMTRWQKFKAYVRGHLGRLGL